MRLFYDAPTPPPGVLDAILAVPANSSSVKTQSFVDFISSLGPDSLGTGTTG